MAELADAQDLGFCASRILKVTHRCSTNHSAYRGERLAGFRRALLCSFFLIAWLQISESPAIAQKRAFTVPFHTVNGLILLDATVNGKAAVMVLDTGATVTLYNHAGADRYISIELEPKHLLTVKISDMAMAGNINGKLAKLSEIAPVDGILGNDVLRTFQAVRIDYKAQTVTLEQ